jgi:hypothetical protein
MKVVKPQRRRFATMTVDEIFASWEASARKSLRKGQKYAPEIFAPRGRTVQAYKRTIRQRMRDAAHPFNAADFRRSNRVARDTGRICALLAAAAADHVVTLDVFQRAAALARVHPACPMPNPGSGRWCDGG